MERKEAVLLVLNKAGKTGLTPARLQKSLFLLTKNFSSVFNFYNFQPYNYGPFDRSVYLDADSLAEEGFVDKIDSYSTRTLYRITSKGKEMASEIVVDPKIELYTTKMISWIQSLSFQQLISSIYKKYPEFKVNSIFRG
jgi:uncharacterized protein